MQKKLPRPRRGQPQPPSFENRVMAALDDLRRSAQRGDLQLAVVRRERRGFKVIATIPSARQPRGRRWRAA